MQATNAAAYVELHRDVIINSDLWTATPHIITADLGFEGIIGVAGLQSADDLHLAIAAGAGVNLDYASQAPEPPLRNLTSAASPLGVVGAGFGGTANFYDALPIVFSWPLRPSTVSPTDIEIELNTGERVQPSLAALNPNYDHNERHVLVVFGEFANRLMPGVEGAVYPVAVRIVDDGSPLMAVGPTGPVSLVGLEAPSGNPFVAGPSLVGARLSHFSAIGDFAPPSLSNGSANDGETLYGEAATYRLRLFTSGGFSPDGVSGFLPGDFSRFFRLYASDTNGTEVKIDQAGVTYDLGVGSLRVVGLADLGGTPIGDPYLDAVYYVEDHDNYVDIILSGDATAVSRLTAVEIPTSAVHGYSDIYTPGGPGRTPQGGTTYTEPAAQQRFTIELALDTARTVSYSAQAIGSFDQAADLPVVFRLYQPATGDHFYTMSSIEAAQALRLGYVEEGVPFANEQNRPALIDVFRFYNAVSGDHFYTTSVEERDEVINKIDDYIYEGIAFQVAAGAEPGTAPIHRFFDAGSGDHMYSFDPYEGLASGYVYEGIAWHAALF